jgi:hypothetical protein
MLPSRCTWTFPGQTSICGQNNHSFLEQAANKDRNTRDILGAIGALDALKSMEHIPVATVDDLTEN